MDLASSSRATTHYSATSSQRTVSLGHSHKHQQLTSHHRTQRRVVAQALFDPPPFRPDKLTVRYALGAKQAESRLPQSRKYTLTHNDITGELQLTVGCDYNYAQISGFYTQLLRDEVKAEWKYEPSPSLHIYCHVSGEERWLAPPMLRNYIFRREMPLVLDTLVYADQQLLADQPQLSRASVYVHLQSNEEYLNSIECWGILGQRSTWQPVPTSILQRLFLALTGQPLPSQPTTSSSQGQSTSSPHAVSHATRAAVVAALDVEEDTSSSLPLASRDSKASNSSTRHDSMQRGQAVDSTGPTAAGPTEPSAAAPDADVNVMACSSPSSLGMSMPRAVAAAAAIPALRLRNPALVASEPSRK